MAWIDVLGFILTCPDSFPLVLSDECYKNLIISESDKEIFQNYNYIPYKYGECLPLACFLVRMSALCLIVTIFFSLTVNNKK